MSLCLIDVHGDIEGDFEWVEDLPKNRKEFLIAIDVLEKLKVKVIGLSYDCKISTVDRYEIEKLIDERISELKGENK